MTIGGTGGGRKNDVYATLNGVGQWTQRTDDGGFGIRESHGAELLNGDLIVFAGRDGNQNSQPNALRDVRIAVFSNGAHIMLKFAEFSERPNF